MSPNEAAYLAGLFDGEGSIVVYARRDIGRLALRVQVSNTDFRIHEWLRATTGTGYIGRFKHENPKHADSGEWQIYGQNAAALLRQIVPYLVIKKEHALYAIATQEPPYPRALWVDSHPRRRHWTQGDA